MLPMRYFVALVLAGLACVVVVVISDNSSQEPGHQQSRVTFNRQPGHMSSQGELLLCAESSDPVLSKEAKFRSSAGNWSHVSRSSYRNSTSTDGEVTFIPTKAGPRCMFYRPSPISADKPYLVLLRLVVNGRVEQVLHLTVLPSKP